MEDKENIMKFNIITSPGSSVASSSSPTSHPPRRSTAITKKPQPMAISGAPAPTSPRTPLLTANPAFFIRDSFKTSVESWSSGVGGWILPEALQSPILKFCLRSGKAILFVTGLVQRGHEADLAKTPSYALVWPKTSVASWACDTRRAQSPRGYLEVSFALRLLDNPQLIAFGGGNTRPVVLQPNQLSERYDHLRRLVNHVQSELISSSAAWLRFTSCRPVHPASKTLADRGTIPGMVPLSTDLVAASPAPVSPTIPAALQSEDRAVQQVDGDGANNVPVDPEHPVQRRQESAVLIDLLAPSSEAAPPSLATPLAPTTFADLFGVTIGSSPSSSLSSTLTGSSPPAPPTPQQPRYARLPFTEGFAKEPATLVDLNGALQASAATATAGGKQAYLAALERKREYLEKLWDECEREIERVMTSS